MHEKGSFPYVVALHATVCVLRRCPPTTSSYSLTLLHNLFIKPKAEKQEEGTPHPGRERRKEGLPGFTRTNHNHCSHLGLRLISYKYTGKELYWKGTGTDPKSRVLAALRKITLSAHCKREIIFSCSHWTEGQMISLKPTSHLEVLGGKGKWYFIFL